MKQNMLKMLVIALVFSVMFNGNVFAVVDVVFPSGGNSIEAITGSANLIWNTIIPIVQMLAFGAIIFAGLRYMFASADKKADIKKSLTLLVIGAILVFATSTVVQFVVNAGNEIIN